MRVLIVNPCARPDPRGFSSWSSDAGLYVSSLHAGGHQAQVLTTPRYDETELRAAADSFGPRVVVIFTRSRQADQARAIGAFFALNYRNVVVFFTGPHASAWPADVMNVAQGVYAIRGYADHLLSPLCDMLQQSGDFFSLPGLSFPVLNRFYHNPVEQPPELSARPLPDRALTGYPALVAGLLDSVGAEIDTSRGDYNTSDRTQASFDMAAPATGVVPPFQQRTVVQVIDEANALRQVVPGLRFLGLRDENCLADPEWSKELARAWKSHVGLPFWVCSRPEFLKESIYEALGDAGCFRVIMNVESGSDHVRRRVLGRRCADSHVLYAARAARRFGMALITANEMGFPGETETMIQETIDLNRRMKPDWALASVFHPEPGTAIFQRAESKKWLTPSAYGIFYDPDTRVEQPWVRPRKVEEYLRSFNEKVFDSKPLEAQRP